MSHAASAPPHRELGILGAIVQQHRHRLLARLRLWMHGSPLRRRVDPEDIVADTFLFAARRGARLESANPALSYRCLCRIAHDCLIQSWRRETRQRRDVRRDRSWPEQPVAEFESGLFAVDEEPAERAEREHLRARMLATLGHTDRQILQLRYYERLSYRQIGELLGISESAAMVRCCRALKRLRGLLHDG